LVFRFLNDHRPDNAVVGAQVTEVAQNGGVGCGRRVLPWPLPLLLKEKGPDFINVKQGLKAIDGGTGGEAAAQWSVQAIEGDVKMEVTVQWSA
jgi:hypothetical protein